MRKRAFTLAEVLITLTIIGVIAAITIPNLIQSYKKHQVEVGVKEAYSILNNALNMAKAENGSFQEITETSNAQGSNEAKANYFMNNYLKPYMKYSKACEVNACSTSPVFHNNFVKRLDGTYENHAALTPNASMATMALENGMHLGFIGWGNLDFHFIVDINGKKGPNQFCYDTFYFSLALHNKEFMLTGGYVGGDADYLTLFTQYASYKNMIYEGSEKGQWCATALQINGWKIPDDYPVKKF